MAIGMAIDAAGDVLEAFPHQQGRDSTGIFDDLDPAPEIAAGFGEGFPMLGGDAQAELLESVLEHHLRAEKNLGSLVRRCVAPVGKGLFGGGDDGLDLCGPAQRNLCDDAAAGRIEHRAEGPAGWGDPLTAEIIGTNRGLGTHVKCEKLKLRSY